MQHEKSKYELLREKNILAILDGDTDFGFLEINGENSNIKVSMPYLSGPMLCDMSNKFGLPVTYAWDGGASPSARPSRYPACPAENTSAQNPVRSC